MSRARTKLALAASLLAFPGLARAQGPGEVAAPAPVPATNDVPAAPEAGPVAPAPTPADAPTHSLPAAPEGPIGPPTPAPTGPAVAPAASQVAPVAPVVPVASSAPAAESSATNSEISPQRPRLQVAAGFLFGPHALGEADCQNNDEYSECQHRGNFLGAGATIELRAQLHKALYLHVRGLVVGNVRKRPYAVHTGLAGGGLGLGAYSRLAFIRGEYMLIPAFGPDTYVPPFYDKQVARDVYGLHAAMISGGLHKYVTPTMALELWAGFVVGPSSRRTSVVEQVNEKRVLLSFMVSLGLVFDVLHAKGYTPPPKQKRQRRVW